MSERHGRWSRQLRQGQDPLILEVGRVAPQVKGSVLLTAGRNVLLVTAVSRPEPATDLGFFPLTVEYREKMAGAGRIPGGFLRREARAGNHEILGSRVVDRTVRPFFPDGFMCETQILATVMSFDPEGDAEVMAITGASAALTVSEIPWGGPVAGVRVARVQGEMRLFPTRMEREMADLDLLVSVSRQGLVMVEGSAGEVPEETLLEALAVAGEGATSLLEVQEEMRADRGAEKRIFQASGIDPVVREKATAVLRPRIDELFAAQPKHRRHEIGAELITAVEEVLTPDDAEETGRTGQADLAESALGSSEIGGAKEPQGMRPAVPGLSHREVAERILREEIRSHTLDGQRLDGRAAEEVRPISGEVAWLPSAHGSSIFTRGETQALVTCTLGTGRDQQMIEDLTGVRKESFLLHYNFPPYSVGEVKPIRGPSRRDIGHGILARRALWTVLPDFDDYPVTIRVESEIASSNGSSSMATVCGGSLALMDAGVPIHRPVAGVAMGLIVEGDRSVILTDILGDEDHLGDMDFKVAGTDQGITAVQMDNKIGSLPRETLERALEQARRARLHILEQMSAIRAAPRSEPPSQAPQVSFLQIRPARIRDLIGPGGRHIQGLQEETGVKVDIEDDGRVRIYAEPGAKLQEAMRRVHYLTGEPCVGKIYRGRVTGLPDFGCFVELFRGIEGLVHVSELDKERVESPSQIAGIDDEMIVKVLGVSRDGKIQLSRKAALGVDAAEIEGQS